MPLVKSHFYDSELFDDLKRMNQNNFSYDGAKVLLEYLQELADDCGSNIEYDPIAFCCEYAEYADSELPDYAAEYDRAPQAKDFEDSEEFKTEFLDWLRSETTVIEFDGGIIVQSF